MCNGIAHKVVSFLDGTLEGGSSLCTRRKGNDMFDSAKDRAKDLPAGVEELSTHVLSVVV